jgi:hypothetical protein
MCITLLCPMLGFFTRCFTEESINAFYIHKVNGSNRITTKFELTVLSQSVCCNVFAPQPQCLRSTTAMSSLHNCNVFAPQLQCLRSTTAMSSLHNRTVSDSELQDRCKLEGLITVTWFPYFLVMYCLESLVYLHNKFISKLVSYYNQSIPRHKEMV